MWRTVHRDHLAAPIADDGTRDTLCEPYGSPHSQCELDRPAATKHKTRNWQGVRCDAGGIPRQPAQLHEDALDTPDAGLERPSDHPGPYPFRRDLLTKARDARLDGYPRRGAQSGKSFRSGAHGQVPESPLRGEEGNPQALLRH
jgi:hypothetical protein